MEWIKPPALIALGAVFGANLRYFVSSWLARHLTASFPLGTFVVNTTGSFVLGFFLVWTTERVLASPQWRLLIAVGFCGSYTTFSSYTFETFAMMEQGRLWDAGMNFLANNALCFLCTILGAIAARAI
jgi:CrcB protein